MPDLPHPSAATALLHRDLPWIDPHDAAHAFADDPVLALLDSTGPVGPESRYSALCIDPWHCLSAPPGRLDALLDQLRATLAAFPLQADTNADTNAMPFRAGAVGFIGYDAAATLQGVAVPASASMPGAAFAFYDLVIGFDRVERRVRVHSSGLPETSQSARHARALARLDWVCARLSQAPAAPATPPIMPRLGFQPRWTRQEYARHLHRLLDYIVAGDIFQANLTMAHSVARPPGLAGWAIHAALRAGNPAPFGAWLRFPGLDLCSCSPERFLRADPHGRISTMPIKGTAPRHLSDPSRDAASAAALSASSKDRAENTMIVDVLRNDLGRVASIGSVSVPQLCALQSFAAVHHLVSTITARLRPGADAIDLLKASLPGGSITGAPKIRAMQIIAELEATPRGPYCGTIAALGHDGALDSSIVIRTLVATQDRLSIQAGGGIVADSTAESEWNELLLKSAALRAAFGA